MHTNNNLQIDNTYLLYRVYNKCTLKGQTSNTDIIKKNI